MSSGENIVNFAASAMVSHSVTSHTTTQLAGALQPALDGEDLSGVHRAIIAASSRASLSDPQSALVRVQLWTSVSHFLTHQGSRVVSENARLNATTEDGPQASLTIHGASGAAISEPHVSAIRTASGVTDASTERVVDDAVSDVGRGVVRDHEFSHERNATQNVSGYLRGSAGIDRTRI